jgi:ATP-binding cassette subfamily B protein
MTLVATVTVIFSMNASLATLAVLVVPAFYLPTRLVGKVRRRLSMATQTVQADLVAFMEERLNIGGIMLSKLFGQSRADANTFRDHNRQVMELTVKQAMAGRWLFMCLSVISVAGPALIYLFGGRLAIGGTLSIGTIIAFAAYLSNLYRPIGQLANVYVDIQGGLAVFERIFEYLDTTPEVEDRPEAVAPATTRGHIRLEGVSFAYPARRKPTVPPVKGGPPPDAPEPEPRLALDEVSFEVQPGQRVALVGPSGAGKTTITYLLPRFYDPTAGRILLDGNDLRDVQLDSLRAHMGSVTQDTFLFHASIRENLLYARPQATEPEITAAARAANIHDFIVDLADGYETIVGSRGFRLSGGEKQRVAIARALLKDPRILILDEATSNLDATSEYLIQEALEKLLQGRTSIIIAHRLSTILNADQIVVLDHGRVVEIGPHADLVDAGGMYATLYRQQFSRVVQQAQRPPTGNSQ